MRNTKDGIVKSVLCEDLVDKMRKSLHMLGHFYTTLVVLGLVEWETIVAGNSEWERQEKSPTSDDVPSDMGRLVCGGLEAYFRATTMTLKLPGMPTGRGCGTCAVGAGAGPYSASTR